MLKKPHQFLITLVVALQFSGIAFADRIVTGNGTCVVDLGTQIGPQQIAMAQNLAINNAMKECGGQVRIASSWSYKAWRGTGYANGDLFFTETALFDCLGGN